MNAMRFLGLAAAAAVFITLPLWSNQGIVFLAGLVLVEAIFALSWNLLFGYTGLASFGHAAFFALGAYFTGYALKAGLGLPFPLLILASGLIGTAVAVATGLVLLRRTTGIHLAIFTLALAEVLRIIISYSTALGREDGLASIPKPKINVGFATIDLTSGNSYYWFMCVACALLMAFLWMVCNGPFGRVLVCIRQDPERTAFLGVDVARRRLQAFILSGGVAAVSGSLYAPWAQIVTPESAHWVHSTQPMLASLLGGAHSFFGPVIGTVLFSIINYATRNLVGAAEMVIGLTLLIIVLAAPSGVMGLVASLRTRVAPRGVALQDNRS